MASRPTPTDSSTATPVRPVRVLVAGPHGRMGRVMMEGLPEQPGIAVVGGLTRTQAKDPEPYLAEADVLVDFTHLESAPQLLLAAVAAGVRPVSGTSGLSEDVLAAVDEAARKQGIAAVWAPNFRLGGALMAHFATIAAEYMDAAAIVEAHHATKADAPSGTALALAGALHEARGRDFTDPAVQNETLAGVRGGVQGGVRVHSLRLPGIVGWHEVVLAGADELLTIRHEDYGREAYVPNVARAIHEVMRPDAVGLIRGYGAVIGLGR